jgi:transcriptional regulator with XRE-family HTH domain
MPAHRSPSLDGFQPAKFIAFRKKHCKGGQLELARRMGYSTATISLIERGRVKPSGHFLDLLAERFKIDPRSFFASVLALWLLT